LCALPSFPTRRSSDLSFFGIQPGEGNVHLVAAPFYHTAVLTFGGSSLHMGHTLVLMDKWTPEGTLDSVERYRCTTTHMVPTMFQDRKSTRLNSSHVAI